jgi:hypothetical protein
MTFSPESSDPIWPAYHTGEEWWGLDNMPRQMEVTHWMDFPKPPITGGDNER